MDKVFSKIGAAVDTTKHLREIVGMVRAYGNQASKKFIWSKLVYRMRNYDEFESTITSAVNAGLIALVSEGADVKLRYIPPPEKKEEPPRHEGA